MKATMRLSVTTDQCAAFPGHWSLWPTQMFAALNAVTYRVDHPLKVLEFGSGAGTVALAKLLENKPLKFEYLSYENDAKYVQLIEGIKTIIWTVFPPKVDIEFPPGNARPYDLVIIDGLNGVDRIKWYPLLRDHIQPGTILVIDDFDHYPEFQTALDALCKYEVVDRLKAIGNTGMCWITVKVK